SQLVDQNPHSYSKPPWILLSTLVSCNCAITPGENSADTVVQIRHAICWLRAAGSVALEPRFAGRKEIL
ncbi:hypothetical protein FRC12_000676, partial [Ceratobasidium sp. 428]